MTEANIPLVDLKAQYRSLKKEIDAAISSVVENTAFIGGQRVSQFANDFATAIGSEHCVPCANGTDAIYITLKMMGIGDGDEVVTVANSWISTSETISQTGARPVFVDIDEYFHLNSDVLEAAITPRTKAIVPVHLYGQPADMDAVIEIARKHGLYVVEDCAQAHLATVGERTVGTIGAAGTFSFYPGKNLGAYGDAGAIVCNDARLAERCWMYANHGALTKHEHQLEGINSRLDGIQAAVLSVKLPYLRQWTAARQSVAEQYDSRLAEIDEVATPLRRPGTTHVFHLYVIRAERRDELADYLKSKGIGCAIHYPTPLPLLPAYSRYGYRPEQFPAAFSAAKEILSLPIYPELEATSVEKICTSIEKFYA